MGALSERHLQVLKFAISQVRIAIESIRSGSPQECSAAATLVAKFCSTL